MREEIESFEVRLRLGLLRRLKLNDLPRWVHTVGIGGTLAVLLLFIGIFLAYKDVNVWGGWVEATELRSPQYAERIYESSVFRTRMNTWSNLAFVFFGFYAMALAIHDCRSRKALSRGYLASTPAQTALLGLAGIYLGLSSGLFHASLTRFGQQCDVGAMYATMIVLAAICLGSWAPRFPKAGANRGYPTWPLLAVICVAASAYFFIYKWSYSFGNVTQKLSWTLILFVVVSLIQRGKDLQIRWVVAALVLIITGGYIRQLDIEGRFSDPDAICQGHALWHVLSSLFYVCWYFYFRSEERAVSAPTPGTNPDSVRGMPFISEQPKS